MTDKNNDLKFVAAVEASYMTAENMRKERVSWNIFSSHSGHADKAWGGNVITLTRFLRPSMHFEPWSINHLYNDGHVCPALMLGRGD